MGRESGRRRTAEGRALAVGEREGRRRRRGWRGGIEFLDIWLAGFCWFTRDSKVEEWGVEWWIRVVPMVWGMIERLAEAR
jgi:hypothetical protein